MTITAKIIEDSISEAGVRLTTFQLRYPRFIHAEELTHRVLDSQPQLVHYETVPDGFMYDQDLSRNASSSRAVPVKRLIEDIRRDPAMPIHWGKNQPGMQAHEELDADHQEWARKAWGGALQSAIEWAELFANEIGAHKQVVNRLLEPFSHINVVVTATQWTNFFALRRHPDAQPEIKMLADLMWEAMQASTPVLLRRGEWHLPYVTAEDYRPIQMASGQLSVEWIDLARKVSAARAARTSYVTHDGRISTVSEDLELCKRLLANGTVHASPFEHQATPDRPSFLYDEVVGWEKPHLHGNLKGFIQFRKLLPNENITEYVA